MPRAYYRCFICKSMVPFEEVFEVAVVNKAGKVQKKRCCSEMEYLEYTSEQLYRKMVFDSFKVFMGYTEDQVLPTIVNKKVSELHKGYSYRVIYTTLKVNEGTLGYYSSLEDKFVSDYAKVSYFLAIVANSINDVAKKVKAELAQEKREALQYQNHEGRDFDDNGCEVVFEWVNDVAPNNQVAKMKDISVFLDE